MKRRRNRRIGVTLGVVAVLALVAGGWWYYRGTQLSAAEAATPAVQTTRARLGNMSITIAGSGVFVPGSTVSFGFASGGTVTAVLAQVGDAVEAGQMLAHLDDAQAQMKVSEAEISLQLSELKLAQLDEEPDAAEVAAAKASLASALENLADVKAGPSAESLAAARASLSSAQQKYQDLAAGPSNSQVTSAGASLEKARLTLQSAQVGYADVATDPNKAAAAYDTYQRALLDYSVAQASYDAAVEGTSSADLQSALAQVSQAQESLDKLLASPTEAEVALAESQGEQAQAKLDALLAGATDVERQSASLDVQKARNTLQQAQWDLDGMVLRSPISGTITVMDSALTVGQSIGTAAVVSVADLNRLQVQFYVDETEMGLLAKGQPVHVVFDAWPERTFTGQVSRIEPGLKTISNVPVATAWADLDAPDQESGSVTFMEEMNAAVEVVAADQRNVVLVATGAVRQIAAGQYAVFVVGDDGELTLRPVQVGLTDNINYEIVSGLEAGEVVSTGVVDLGE